MVVQTCPYCGVYVEQSTAVQEFDEHEPPYNLSNAGESSIPASPFANLQGQASQDTSSQTAEVTAVIIDDAKSVLLPIAFLVAGSVFFLFGLAVALFSEEGVLTLSWKGEYWFAYLFGGLACLLFGWRALQGVDK